jgi:hypothetical protein
VPGSGSARITPALVNLVCTGARLNYAAYAGTILDLAGRGYFARRLPLIISAFLPCLTNWLTLTLGGLGDDAAYLAACPRRRDDRDRC